MDGFLLQSWVTIQFRPDEEVFITKQRPLFKCYQYIVIQMSELFSEFIQT